MEFLWFYLLFLIYFSIQGTVIFEMANNDHLSDKMKVRWTYIIFFLPLVGMLFYGLFRYSTAFGGIRQLQEQ